MKSQITFLTTILLVFGASQLDAQLNGGGMGGTPSGPGFSGEMLKLLGEHKAFSADLEFQVREGGKGKPMTLPGRIAMLDGKTRFEMDLTLAKGEQIPPGSAAQLKQMGMDKMVTLSLPDKKLSYLIYPGLEAYVELPISDAEAGRPASDFEMKVTELGREEVAGHNCVKNKVVVTDKEGNAHESTVWNSIDLKEFPVKIETTDEGHEVVLVFTNVKLSKPAADKFTPPAAYTKHDSLMGMMQQIMMKRMGGGVGAPPAK